MMKRISRVSSKRFKPGLTLIETVLGAAILGSLLVAILMAVSRMHVQAARAEMRLTACWVADDLLESWWTKPEAFPRQSSGSALRTGWSWRTQVVENSGGRALGGEVVRLEVFGPFSVGPGAAASVEVLLPEENDAVEGGDDAR